jgi:hypothetical protein
MLTDEETRVAAYAFALHLDDKGFVPTDSYLPECERLRERGWLARRIDGGEPVYDLTPGGRLDDGTPPTRQPRRRQRELKRGLNAADVRRPSGQELSVHAYALRGCKLEARLRSGRRRQGLCALRTAG